MNDPHRYLDDEHADPVGRTLVRSASHDGLDAAQMATLARTLGADEREAAHSLGGRAASSTRSASPQRVLTVAKWGGVVAVAAMIAVGGELLARRDGDVPSASLPPAKAAATPGPLPTAASAPVRAVPPSPEAVPVALLPEAPAAPTSTPAVAASAHATQDAKRNAHGHGASPSSASEDLSAEVRALERVRIAVAEHRVADARAGLASYERTFPNGLLKNEARVLEIATLLAEERRDEAEARARAFLASSPDSPYANRVRSLIAGTQHR